MVVQLLTCPGCGAADTSRADTHGIHTCVYCGVRYRIRQGCPQLERAAAGGTASGAKIAVFAALAGIFVLVTLGAIAYRMTSGPVDPPPVIVEKVTIPAPTPQPTPTNNSPNSPSSPQTVAIAAPTPQASTPAPVAIAIPAAPVAPPAVEAPATATFAAGSSQRTAGALRIYGFVENTSTYPLGQVKVTAVLYGDDDQEVGHHSGYSEWSVLPPGERSPITIFISDPPEHTKIAYEVHAKKPSYLPPVAEGLEVEASPPERSSFLGWRAIGKVHNRGDTTARFVRVDLLGFDAEDHLVARGFTFADGDTLAPGASARFELSVLDSKVTFDRVEFHVRGQVAN